MDNAIMKSPENQTDGILFDNGMYLNENAILTEEDSKKLIENINNAVGWQTCGSMTEARSNMASAVVDDFYYSLHPNATEVALGEGILNVLLCGFSILGILIGCIISFVACIAHLRKKELLLYWEQD